MLMQPDKEDTHQLRLCRYEEINHPQGSKSNSSEFKVHALGDSSDNHSSSEEENREVKEFDLENMRD